MSLLNREHLFEAMMIEDTSMEKLLTEVESGRILDEVEGPKGVTAEEVFLHNKLQDAWIILNGEALDVTRWIPLHPGGQEAIARLLGKDASLEWNMIHTPGTLERNRRFLSTVGQICCEDANSSNAGVAKGTIGLIFGLGCCKRRRG